MNLFLENLCSCVLLMTSWTVLILFSMKINENWEIYICYWTENKECIRRQTWSLKTLFEILFYMLTWILWVLTPVLYVFWFKILLKSSRFVKFCQNRLFWPFLYVKINGLEQNFDANSSIKLFHMSLRQLIFFYLVPLHLIIGVKYQTYTFVVNLESTVDCIYLTLAKVRYQLLNWWMVVCFSLQFLEVFIVFCLIDVCPTFVPIFIIFIGGRAFGRLLSHRLSPKISMWSNIFWVIRQGTIWLTCKCFTPTFSLIVISIRGSVRLC